MKNLLFLLSVLFVVGCSWYEPTNGGFDMGISTFNVSHKSDSTIWIQSPISTESFSVDSNTFKSYNVGDSMTVLIHNTEKVTSSGVPYDTFSAFTKKYVISHKRKYTSPKYGSSHTIWFKTNTETKSCDVNSPTFSDLNIGDTIVVLYKTKRHYVPDTGVIF